MLFVALGFFPSLSPHLTQPRPASLRPVIGKQLRSPRLPVYPRPRPLPRSLFVINIVVDDDVLHLSSHATVHDRSRL